MGKYYIVTDTGADAFDEEIASWDVKRVDLTFQFDDNGIDLTNREMPYKEFYSMMREGHVSKTAAPGIEIFKDMMIPLIEEGYDILYVGFSTGISNTYYAGEAACRELAETYPERTIIPVSTFCASAGETLILYSAVQNKKNGMTIEENAQWLEDNKKNLDHWFTVDDLQYLKRGGRVSAASAFAATVLDIKPILHVDDEGKLINMAKVRGRKASIKGIFKKYQELCLDPENGTYFISHGDCEEDAKALEQMIVEAYGNKCGLITPIGPVIGSHAGPGTLALFFYGSHR